MHPDLGGRLRLGQQAADQATRPGVLHPGVPGLVAPPGVRQRAPGRRQRHRRQQRQQHRMQHGQHARRRDQRYQGAHHTRGVRDHPARRSGAVLGGVQQFVEGVVLDRGQLHGGRPLQVQLGGHPLHLGLQAPGRPRGRGPQQRPDQGHGAHDRQHRYGVAQPVLDRAAGDQPPQHAVHGQQADRLRHAPAHLGRDHRARRPPVGLPGQPAARPQQLRQPRDHGPQTQLQESVVVPVPAHVVTQRAAEQQPLRLGQPGLARTGTLPPPPEDPHPPTPPRGTARPVPAGVLRARAAVLAPGVPVQDRSPLLRAPRVLRSVGVTSPRAAVGAPGVRAPCRSAPLPRSLGVPCPGAPVRPLGSLAGVRPRHPCLLLRAPRVLRSVRVPRLRHRRLPPSPRRTATIAGRRSRGQGVGGRRPSARAYAPGRCTGRTQPMLGRHGWGTGSL